ncbi:unnamed protein product [Linum trigynum]|uniref:Uncharacterized protein n=1 Tax=Linum trigynum TaxID=586398 RepID=A0AAV2G6V1_9ROSI
MELCSHRIFTSPKVVFCQHKFSFSALLCILPWLQLRNVIPWMMMMMMDFLSSESSPEPANDASVQPSSFNVVAITDYTSPPSPAALAPPVIHRSNRICHPPRHLVDTYEVDLPSFHTLHVSSFKYPLEVVVNYAWLSPNHRAYIATISREVESQSFKEAIHHAHWRAGKQK